jgi:histidinol dehydrogenase
MHADPPLRIDRLDALEPADRRRLLERAGSLPADVLSTVRTVIRDVRERGDAALLEYTERFDGVRLERLEVRPEEYEDALRAVEPGVLRALETAYEHIASFHAAQLRPQPEVETSPGVWVWREWRPIERVGVYAPGGRAVYPSSMLMNAAPAAAAGCAEIVACAPPDPHGLVPAPTLAAAQLAGVHRVFKLGGAQAVAAMAYGAGSVPRVHKVFGAGSVWVTAAKLEVFPDADIDMPAGPSEILVLADAASNPALVAADLLAQAEHGADSACVLVTSSVELAERVAAEVGRQLNDLPHRARCEEALRAYGRILVVDTLRGAVEFANEYAPEHLSLLTEEPEALLPLVRNAGSIFVGPYAPVAAGDYATGANHVLPTGGHARAFGPLSVEEFGRWVQVQRVSRDGLLGLRETIVALAEAEGLHAHARSVDLRFEG